MDTNEVKAPVSLHVQFVVGGNGEPTAVLVDIDTWNHVLNKLKEAEDLAESAQGTMNIDPDSYDLEKAGYRTWQSVRAEMHEQLLQEQEQAIKEISQDRGDIKVQRCC